jgi:uncharacterized RDD family membrane protein YckC
MSLEEQDILGPEDVVIYHVDNGKRFLHYIIDTIVRYLVMAIPALILESMDVVNYQINEIVEWVGIIIFMGYYPIMEFAFQQTVGKMITKSVVVNDFDYGKPSFLRVVGRSLARLIPFEAFSFLGRNPGWHDSISKTLVISKKDWEQVKFNESLS